VYLHLQKIQEFYGNYYNKRLHNNFRTLNITTYNDTMLSWFFSKQFLGIYIFNAKTSSLQSSKNAFVH